MAESLNLENPNFKGRVLRTIGDAIPVPRSRRLVPITYQEARHIEFSSASLGGNFVAFEDNHAWTRHHDLEKHGIPTMTVAWYREQFNLVVVPPSSEPLSTYIKRNAQQPEHIAPVMRQCGAILSKIADVQIMPDLSYPSFRDEDLLPHSLVGQFAVTHHAGGQPSLTVGLPYVFPDRSAMGIVQRVTEELSVSGSFLPPTRERWAIGELPLGSDLQDVIQSFKQGVYET